MKLKSGLTLLVVIFFSARAQSNNELAGTSWVLQEYGSEGTLQTVVGNAPITLVIDAEGQRVSGSASCNSYSGDLTLEGSSFTVGTPVSTLKACAENIMQQEQAFFAALSAVTTFELSEAQLILLGGGQRLLFVADGSESSAPSENGTRLENTSWILTALAGNPIAANTTITLEFRDGGLGGSAGCNSYRGKATFESSAVTVSPLITTRKACAETIMNQELTYLNLLQSATTFEATDTTLTLLSGEDRLEFASATSSEPSSSRPPSATTITSSNLLNVEDFNSQLASDPLTLALSVVNIPDAPNVTITRQDTSDTESVITVIAEGLEDDSVAAQLQQFVLTLENGQWRVSSALEAFRCARGENTSSYVAGPCP
jgi:heat shock protein HslJ